MVAVPTKGIKWLMVRSDATGETVTPSGITAAKPAVVSTASTGALVDGNLIKIPQGATGMPSIDGKTFVIGNLAADSSFELVGSDSTGDTYSAGTSPDLIGFTTGDTIPMCWNRADLSVTEPSPVSVGTTCDPDATAMPSGGVTQSLAIGGYSDINDASYVALKEAVKSGANYDFWLPTPGLNNGTYVFSGTFGALTYQIPISGDESFQTWQSTIALSRPFDHLF